MHRPALRLTIPVPYLRELAQGLLARENVGEKDELLLSNQHESFTFVYHDGPSTACGQAFKGTDGSIEIILNRRIGYVPDQSEEVLCYDCAIEQGYCPDGHTGTPIFAETDEGFTCDVCGMPFGWWGNRG